MTEITQSRDGRYLAGYEAEHRCLMVIDSETGISLCLEYKRNLWEAEAHICKDQWSLRNPASVSLAWRERQAREDSLEGLFRKAGRACALKALNEDPEHHKKGYVRYFSGGKSSPALFTSTQY